MGAPYSSGCENCKKRRIRCDASKPFCLKCRKAGVQCLGYTQRGPKLANPQTLDDFARTQNHHSQISSRDSVASDSSTSSLVVPALRASRPFLLESPGLPERSHRVEELIDLGLNIMYPKYVDVDASGTYNPMAPHWAQAIFNDTSLLYAALFAFSKYREFLLGRCIDQNDQLFYLTTCLSHLRTQLHQANSEASDELILTILSLVPSEVKPDAKTNPAAQRAAAQPWVPPWLTVYAKTVDRSPHIHAAFRLVEMRGGIESIKLYGLQRLVAFNDVRVAAYTLTIPRFPLPKCMPWIYVDFSFARRRTSDPSLAPPGFPRTTSVTFLDQTNSNVGWTLGGIDIVNDPGDGFRHLFTALDSESSDVQTFTDFATLSFLLENHKSSHVLADLPNHVLMDATVCVLHRLLSLPKAALEPSTDPATSILCATRLAVLLYAFRYLFPLPRTAFPLLTMVRDLSAAVLRAYEIDQDESIQKALFWCTMIGAKATVGTSENKPFLTLLRMISTPWGIRNEEAARPVLCTFAWPDSGQDPGFWSPPESYNE